MKYRATIWAGDTEAPMTTYTPMVYTGIFDTKEEAFDAVETYISTKDVIDKVREAYQTELFTCSISVFVPLTREWREISKAIEII